MNNLIAQDFCDTDLYKFSQGQLFFNQFSQLKGKYKYINRSADKRYRKGFSHEVQEQVNAMKDLSLSSEMCNYLQHACPWLKSSYLQWLMTYRYNPRQVTITQNKNDELEIEISGHIFEVIFWEIPLLYIISELSTNNKRKSDDWIIKIYEKAKRYSKAGITWIDFGTRRRFDFETQNAVVEKMSQYKDNFRGTSNPFLAKKYNVKPFGTFAHEFVMAMQGVYGITQCNIKAMEHWVKEYRGDLGIALADTLTTEIFLKDFDMYFAKLFDGVRIDSGNPFDKGLQILSHYKQMRIMTQSKTLVFSNALRDDQPIELHNQFKEHCLPVMGIGTYLTNDVGIPAPDHVIKLTHVDVGNGYVPVIKLSDSRGKETGDYDIIEAAKKTLNII